MGSKVPKRGIKVAAGLDILSSNIYIVVEGEPKFVRMEVVPTA